MSALLSEWPAQLPEVPQATPLPAAHHFRLESWIATQAPLLEAWRDPNGPEWPAGRTAPRGTRLLELQALCPFRAFAELRLGAEPLEEPAPGIDRRLRGKILHHTLELFWRGTGSWQVLQARDPRATRELASECIERALHEALQGSARALDPQIVRREAERNARLLDQLVDWELSREPFETLHLEWPQRWEIAGTALRLRIDRVDRLADGSLLVVDYKTGTAKTFDADAERPVQPQLPAYTLAAGPGTVAAVQLHLSRNGVELRGMADRAGRLPRLAAHASSQQAWEELRGRWQQRLTSLAREFLAGYAAVQPQPKACERCHLKALCRIESLDIPRR